ncbi:MAG: class I SAM-dependent methyltransferase [Flavobacteriaceae bacterium]|nr:class I SAM-dependent methyltransferase [Bacteroidia bacterium]NNL60746.1 class I SAM-dependent methyltransferase [Flavobacteriaceae bacterium]
MENEIKKNIETYYNEKLKLHGATAKGVDWNGDQSQFLRFEQLSKVITKTSDFSILDFGCGFGSFIDFLKHNQYDNFKYVGYDISSEMLEEGRNKYKGNNIAFTDELAGISDVDYAIASGIFNVRLETKNDEWIDYIKSTLRDFNELATKGFSFNLLTSFSDKEFMKDYLFYAEPTYFFNYCKEHFSRNVALLHDYDLYEFTIIVRK